VTSDPVDIAVRAAGAADVESLEWLQGLARTAAVDMRGGVRWLEETPAIVDWTVPSVFVGTIDGVVVGMLAVALGDRVAGVAEVLLAFVHPEARELGLGDEMLAEALQAARAAGCRVFEGTALPGDRDTKNLYERAAITARKLTVSTPL
jgi:GNAT superfamily N-acetyltransferase